MDRLNKKSLTAVHDEDLEKYLEKLGILEKFNQGELKCKFCRSKITFENLHSLFPQSGDIKLVCDNLECVEQLYALLREGEIEI